MILQDDLQLIRERIDAAEYIGIFAHIRPDGDSVGSCMGLGWALEDAGKKVQYISEDEIPFRYQFLFEFTSDGRNPFVREPDPDIDCFITPDISAEDRAGRYFLDRGTKPDICIDHHVSNAGTGKLNWIEPESPAACCVLTGILPRMGFTLTKRISSALLCGIITDTNSFTNSNVDSQSLRYAADLVDHGAEIFPIVRKAHKEHSSKEIELWKIGMNNIHMEGSLIWSVLPKADRDRIGLPSDDDAGFVSYLANTVGCKVSVLFIEQDEKSTKISWRGVPGCNVANVAVAVGGGGHAAASGATIKGKLEEIIPDILERTRAIIF